MGGLVEVGVLGGVQHHSYERNSGLPFRSLHLYKGDNLDPGREESIM